MSLLDEVLESGFGDDANCFCKILAGALLVTEFAPCDPAKSERIESSARLTILRAAFCCSPLL